MSETDIPVRLEASLLAEVRRAADAEGVAVDELVSIVSAEEVAALRADAFSAERSARANPEQAFEILNFDAFDRDTDA